jgi:hypothetical protein
MMILSPDRNSLVLKLAIFVARVPVAAAAIIPEPPAGTSPGAFPYKARQSGLKLDSRHVFDIRKTAANRANARLTCLLQNPETTEVSGALAGNAFEPSSGYLHRRSD